MLNCAPPNYTFLSCPRNISSNISSSGGGTGFLIRELFTQLPTSAPDFSFFESTSVTLQLARSKISVFNIYRPPSSSTHSKPISTFLDDFSSFMSFAATTPQEFIITGDFNRCILTFVNKVETPITKYLSVTIVFCHCD